MITPSDYLRWKQDPVTVEILKFLQGQRQETTFELESGRTCYDDPGKTQKETAYNVGIIEGLDLILNLDIEEI